MNRAGGVVVVGAGVMGASIAYHLARRGVPVDLVEARRPASGATGSSFGWIGDSGEVMGGGALAEWHRLEREVADVRVAWTGSLSWPPAGEYGRHELLDGAQVAELEPHLRRPPARAVWRAGDGAIDPVAVTSALVREASSAGARVLANTTVTSLRLSGPRVVGVETSGGFVAADTVVLAAGTGVPGVRASVPVTSSPAALLRFSAPPGLVRRVVSGPAIEIRPGAGDELLVPEICDGDTSEAFLEGLAERTLREIGATFRGAEDVRLIDVSVGARPIPADGEPVVGRVPGVAGLYAAVMHSGVALAPRVGRLVTEELLDGLESPVLRPYRPARFATRFAAG